MKALATDPARRRAARARRVRRSPRPVHGDVPPRALPRARRRHRPRVRAGQLLVVGARASLRGLHYQLAQAAGQARARHARRSVRRRGRHPPRLADVRPVVRHDAVAPTTTARCGSRRASPTASSCSRTTPTSSTRSPRSTTPDRRSRDPAGTTPTSGSRGRSRARPCRRAIRPRTPPARVRAPGYVMPVP